MKRKKLLTLLLALAVVLGSFAGCAADHSGNAYPGENMVGTQEEKPEGIYDNASGEAASVTDRKLIRTVHLSAETEDLDALLTAVADKVTELGGYVENREVYSGSKYSSYSKSRWAELTVRIPAKNLDAFVSHVGKTGNVTSSSESSEDVTLSYVAVESRMKALQKEEERLLALIDQAKDLSELLQLESRLTEVRTELEEVTSQLRLYDNLVDYGTVHLSVSEVQKLTPAEEPGFWERIGSGFMESLGNLWAFLQEFAIFLVVSLPYLLPLGLIALVIVLLIRRKIRRNRKKKQPPFETGDPSA